MISKAAFFFSVRTSKPLDRQRHRAYLSGVITQNEKEFIHLYGFSCWDSFPMTIHGTLVYVFSCLSCFMFFILNKIHLNKIHLHCAVHIFEINYI